jgi:hypothetical protein
LAVAADGLALRIVPSEITAKLGETVDVPYTIANNTKKAVKLLMPGNDSNYGWRTPRVGWSVLRVEGASSARPHPKEPPVTGPPRCAISSPLNRVDTFVIRPGEKEHFIGAISPLLFPAPGQYKAVFYYRNDPRNKFRGFPPGRNAPAADRAIKKSTACDLISNEILITVTASEP